MSKSGGNLTVQYNLRWTEELRDKIAEAAKENTRSMNQEIVARLESSLQQPSLEEDDIEQLTNDRVIGLLDGIIYSFQFSLQQNKAIQEDCTTRDAFEIAMFELGAIKHYIKNKHDLSELYINTPPKALKALEKVVNDGSVEDIRRDFYAEVLNKKAP